MRDEELSGEDAWQALRRYGGLRLVRESFARFRYGDGFSHSRALALQMSLAAVPLVIAIVGLSRTLYTASVGEVLRLTIDSVAPGPSGLMNSLLTRPNAGSDQDEVALWLGLGFAIVALTTGMGQAERGSNRIYGIERDRPTAHKYGRGFVMAMIAGIPAMAGVLMLLGATAFGDAVEKVYGIDDDIVTAIGLPVGSLLIGTSVIAILNYSPRRKQPAPSWLVVGMIVAAVLWLGFTGLFAAYLHISDNFSSVYGSLTVVIALLLWTQFTAMSLLFGSAFCAQLEAVRAGVRHGAHDDPEATT